MGASGVFKQGHRYDSGCVLVLRDEFKKMMTKKEEDHSRYRKKNGKSGQSFAEVARLFQDSSQEEFILVRSHLGRPSWDRLWCDPSGVLSHGNGEQLFIRAGGTPT